MLPLLLFSALSQGAVIPAQPALVEVKRGRARLVGEGASRPLSSLDDVVQARGAAHLEVTAGSVVVVSWRGLATLRFEGPAAFEWGPGTGDGELLWRAVDVAALEAEVRRGVARLELPLGWQADFRAGAYHLDSSADGGTRIVHTAGEDLRIRWIGEGGATRPAAFLQAGQTAELDAPPPLRSRPDRTAAAPAWGDCSWPWGTHGVPGRPDLGSGPAWREVRWPFGAEGDPEVEPWAAVEWPWSDSAAPAGSEPRRAPQTDWEFAPRPTRDAEALPPSGDRSPEADQSTGPTEAQGETPAAEGAPVPPATPTETPDAPEPAVAPEPAEPVEPAPRSANEGATVADEASATSRPPAVTAAATTAADEPSPEPASEPAPPVEPAVQPTPDRALAESTSGPLRHRPHPGLSIEPLEGERWRARVAADAAEPAVILGERFDLWLQPGASIVVDAAGALLHHDGDIELKPAKR